MKNSRTWILDGVFLLFIVLVGWFLIGYYLNYNYLATGYQDWIYHAFRIKSIEEWGIVSWDHKWANGINYWRSYQYIPHLLTLYTSKIFNIGITNAMILWGVATFIYLRVAFYIIFRSLGISRLTSMIVVFISYTNEQQWLAIKDFSIFIASVIIPIYLLIYIKSHQKPVYFILLGTVSGLTWLLHPVLGIALTGMTLIAITIKTKLRTTIPYLSFASLGVAFSSYAIPYLVVGYKFSNPFYSSIGFIRDTLVLPYGGMGLALFVIFVGCGLLVLLVNTKYSWLRVNYFSLVSIYLLIQLTKNGDLPGFINILQIPRSLYFLSILSLLPIAPVIEKITLQFSSKFFLGVTAAFIGLMFTSAVGQASEKTAAVVSTIDTPIKYFYPLTAEGTLYYQNDSEASYFSDPSLRLVGSYNEHLLPSPLSTRYKQIMSGGKSHLIVSQRQIDLINTYSKVLGVEYLVLPIKSPITKSLLSSETEFVYQDDVTVDNSAYSVFRNENNTDYAYVMERSVFDENVALHDLPKPDLRSVSYDVWDNEIESLAGLLESNDVQVLPMEFVNTDELRVNTETMRDFDDPILLITQSYDSNWDVVGDTSATIEPTSLRFMKVEPSSFESEITLKNSWPSWHWPVQYLGFGSVIVSAIAVGVYEMTRKENHAV